MESIITPTKRRRSKSGGGTRKIGRMARKPAHQRYNAERRWEENKEKRLARAKKREIRLQARRRNAPLSEQ
jgi:hypothetical protein